jgi:hypothetical protein
MEWMESSEEFTLNSYTLWELGELRGNPRVQAEVRVAALVELTGGTSANALIDFISANSDIYSIAPHEIDLLVTEQVRETKDRLRTIIYGPFDKLTNDQWEVREVGSPFVVPKPDLAPREGRVIPPPSDEGDGVIVGIIDDGIGFLNERFRDATGKTRFREVFIGASGLKTAPSFLGRQLSAAEINTMIASGRTEEDLYREVNDSVFDPDEHWPSAYHAGHGTAVLDIAAGADGASGDDMVRVPLLAYQLTPSAIGETSGRQLYPAIIVALHWIMAEALRGAGRKQTLIVNLSLGALAGPADDTSQIEMAFQQICDDYARLSLGGTMRIVASYGNARRARLVAKKTLAKDESLVLDWRILPDDATGSFLELRVKAGDGAATGLKVAPSDNPSNVLLLSAFPPAGVVYRYITAAGRIAQLSRQSEPGYDTVLLAVAPTVRDDSRPRSQSGCWRVTLTNAGSGPLMVSAKVQRDDTPAGYRRQGRQSWIDCDYDLWWDRETGDYTAPDTVSPVQRTGTQVSYAGTRDPRVYLVAAGRPDQGNSGALRPSPYSGEADPLEKAYPSVIALADEGAALAGRRGAGIRSGSVARYSGTSVSAPVVTRAFALRALAGLVTVPVVTPGNRHDMVELAALIGGVPLVPPDARAGFGRVPG